MAVKSVFERWSALSEVKIYRYHADKGRFSEQPFRSEIEDSNKTIIFCGVGSHHQNVIVERIFQILILGYRTLLLSAKIYCLDPMTTMLWIYAMKDFTDIR